jgi:hypothetical protein
MEVFTTSEGVEIPLKRVSRVFVARIHAKYPIPEVPTYDAQIVGGGTQTFPHDETTLESAEDHRAWREYQDALEEATSNRLRDTAEFLLYHCIDLKPPPLEEWSVDFGAWGMDPPDPTDEIRYKLDWIDMELVPDRDDYGGLMARLYEQAGVLDSKSVKEFEAFFRLAVERIGAG